MPYQPSKNINWMKFILHCMSVLLICFTPASSAFSAQAVKHTGTFSSMYFNSEGGDVLGAEIRIVYTRNGYEATFQFSEGEPGNLIIVKPVINGSAISFSIKNTKYMNGSFKGSYTKNGISGKFTYSSGSSMKLDLKRKKSYWD